MDDHPETARPEGQKPAACGFKKKIVVNKHIFHAS